MPHAAQIAHHSPGRLRIRVPAAKGNPEALAEIREALAKVSGVNEVLVNELIGTVTVHYDPEHHSNFETHLMGGNGQQNTVSLKLPPKVKGIDDIDEIVDEAQFLADHSHTAKLIFGWTQSLDQGIKRATDNAVDLKVIVPLALAVGVFMELGIAAATPVWLTLGLFSFNHFVDLHSHPPAGPPADPTKPAKSVTKETTSRERPRKTRFP